MDVHPHENGTSTLERVQQREELQAIVADVRELPKTQRTALVLRQIDDLSYTDIAQTMGKSLPSVKSLLIRARMSLAESSAGRAALAPLRAAGAAAKADPGQARRRLWRRRHRRHGGLGRLDGRRCGHRRRRRRCRGHGPRRHARREGRRGHRDRRPGHGWSRERRRTNPDNASTATATAGGARVSATTGATTDETRALGHELAGWAERDGGRRPGAPAPTAGTRSTGRGAAAARQPPGRPLSRRRHSSPLPGSGPPRSRPLSAASYRRRRARLQSRCARRRPRRQPRPLKERVPC